MRKKYLRNYLVLSLLCGAAFKGKAEESVSGEKSGRKTNDKTDEKMKIEYVAPFIGTNGMGHTFPGACYPFGIVQLSPDTDTIPHNIDGVYQPRAYEYCAGYQYRDKTIVGFSHTHFSGTGHSDLGDILVMPTSGPLQLNPGTADNPDGGYRSRYSHDSEYARPGYYEVFLDDYGIKAQLTATKRTGIHKYTYSPGVEQRIILDLIHGIYNYDGKVLWAQIRVESDTLITGYRITNGWARTSYTYFAISFSRPIVNYGCEEKAQVKYKGGYGRFDMTHNFPDIGGRKIVAYLEFDPAKSCELEIRVALSGVSTEGALKNLKAETDGCNFDQLTSAAQAQWEKELSVIEAQGNDYFVKFFQHGQEIIGECIREFREMTENNINRQYPFERFLIVETPASFFSFPRIERNENTYIQPEIAFLPEKGVGFHSINLEKEKQLLMTYHQMESLDCEKKLLFNLFKSLFSDIYACGMRPDIYIGRFFSPPSNSIYRITQNPFICSPIFHQHVNYIHSIDYPFITTILNNIEKKKRH